ncbi:MAG TPA: hypothetical protein VH143_23470 [Kofleriaceae bacterium]|jgi:hypothetical protein|nr:hypothetical protein [Kofleriaceae bacterium]
MSRWIVPLAIAIAFAVPARGEIVIRGPQLTFTCPSAKSLDALASCLKQHSWTYKLVRSVERAKLIEINAPSDPFDLSPPSVPPNLALYVPGGPGLTLGGLFEPDGAYEVFDAQPVTINHTHGFRLDVGVTRQAAMSLADGSSILGVQRTMHALFCAGTDYECTDVVTACDWISDGHEVYGFHGELTLDQRTVRVTGDARFASPLCNGPIEEPLAWP